MHHQISRRNFALLTGAGATAIALGNPAVVQLAEAATTPEAQMKAVLDELGAFNAPPIHKLSPENARNNPTAADAVIGVLAKQGKPAVEMFGDIDWHQS
jgi:acetyl esterase